MRGRIRLSSHRNDRMGISQYNICQALPAKTALPASRSRKKYGTLVFSCMIAIVAIPTLNCKPLGLVLTLQQITLIWKISASFNVHALTAIRIQEKHFLPAAGLPIRSYKLQPGWVSIDSQRIPLHELFYTKSVCHGFHNLVYYPSR